MHSLEFGTSFWGKLVDGVWAGGVQPGVLTHRPNDGTFAWGQSYRFINSLCNKSTQVFPRLNVFFVSVTGRLYPLSTQPIKTTTNLFEKKGI